MRIQENPSENQKKGNLIRQLLATVFTVVVTGFFALVSVLAKPLNPIRSFYFTEMKAENSSKSVSSDDNPSLLHHLAVTILAVAIMGFFALITMWAKPLDPIKRAIKDFSFTDIYYEIQNDADTCRFITLVDLTKVIARSDIAQVITDIESCEPKVVGLDCVFDNEGEDTEGNAAIIDVAEKYKNIVFSEKLHDWVNDSIGYKKAIHSFFSEYVDIKEGTSNMPRGQYDSMKRKMPFSEVYMGKRQPSMISQIACEYTDKDMVKGRTEDMNINFTRTIFRVLQPEEVKKHPELIKGQIVLFGSLYEDSDMHWTPVGKIAGVELLAYGVQTMITQKEIKNIPHLLFILISFLIILLVQILQTYYLKITGRSNNLFTKYVVGSSYIMNILTFLFTSVFIGICFIIFSKFYISFNLAWSLSVIAFLGTSRSMYSAIKDYVDSLKNKYKSNNDNII